MFEYKEHGMMANDVVDSCIYYKDKLLCMDSDASIENRDAMKFACHAANNFTNILSLLKRARNAAGRMEIDLYEDIQGELYVSEQFIENLSCEIPN